MGVAALAHHLKSGGEYDYLATIRQHSLCVCGGGGAIRVRVNSMHSSVYVCVCLCEGERESMCAPYQ